ncbi:C1 family peptidase [Bdellovibrio sp. HCB274]|uniref:C1 family peptidase n=1 Tax=Bdellovibrio sp. HCB274 TaxID=3394361 RepID=UPI0039B3B6C4
MNKLFGSSQITKVLVLTLCLTFGHIDAVNARLMCSGIFTEISWGTLKPDFNHTTTYTKEIPQATAIKNQCNLGTCHQYSWVANLEQNYTANTGEILVLSNHYLSAQQILNRSLNMLTIEVNSAKISLGAAPLISRREILDYGLIPESAWTPKVEFYKEPAAKRMNEYLENIIARTKIKMKAAESSHQKESLLLEGRKQIEEFLHSFIGELPTQFEWHGKTYTPTQFSSAYFGFFKVPYTNMFIIRSRKESDVTTHYLDETTIQTNINVAEKKAVELIDQGHSFSLHYEHHHEYVDKATGIMSIRAFYTPDYAKPLTRKQRKDFSKDSGGHVVQVVGYERSPFTGEIVKWKVRNSWGDKNGDGGFFHMYNDYFRTFAKAVTYTTENLQTIPLKMPVKGQ